MKIAIVGPEVSTSRVVAVVQKKEPFIECIGAPYQDLSEVPQIVRKYQPIVDGLLFTGHFNMLAIMSILKSLGSIFLEI